MAYTALTLVNEAFYLSGIVASTSQPTGAQQSRGLSLLNDILSLKNANNRLIPYFTSATINCVVGQETYLIANLIYPDSITFNLNTIVRIPLEIQSRKEYFGTIRVNTLTTLPFECNINRVKGGANLYIYPLPNSTYPVTINGKFGLLSNVTKFTDLSATYDRFYLVFLRYTLTAYICQAWKVSLSPDVKEELDSLEQQIRDLAPIDLTVTKLSTLQPGNNSLNWGFINLSGGWVP
jgi:hypothetical protein